MPRPNPNDLEDPYQSTPEPEDREDQQGVLRQKVPSLLYKLSYTGQIYGLQGYLAPFLWYRDWKEYFYPPDQGPNIVKKYEVRPLLPVRIFFPRSYDQTSPQTLPTLFTIHGGGFVIGNSRDDDEWNRNFADTQNALVISLNYAKAPWAPFPTALGDVEALLLALLDDESLPIDRTPRTEPARHGLSRTALLGFSSGGNLALAAAQLPSIQNHAYAPAAAVSVYGILDFSVPPLKKLANRPYKPELPPPRGGKSKSDPLVNILPSFAWSYVPYGHDLRDSLLSPAYAKRDRLPPYVGLVAAELDILAHESWRLACRLAREGAEVRGRGTGRGRTLPDRRSKDARWRVCGRTEVGRARGALEDVGPDVDERFAFEESWQDGGVKWLLVPDVLHGFDNPHMRGVVGGDEETVRDAELKTVAYVDELGRWLRNKVWRM